jgi:hypothetical protein
MFEGDAHVIQDRHYHPPSHLHKHYYYYYWLQLAWWWADCSSALLELVFESWLVATTHYNIIHTLTKPCNDMGVVTVTLSLC